MSESPPSKRTYPTVGHFPVKQAVKHYHSQTCVGRVPLAMKKGGKRTLLRLRSPVTEILDMFLIICLRYSLYAECIHISVTFRMVSARCQQVIVTRSVTWASILMTFQDDSAFGKVQRLLTTYQDVSLTVFV